MYNGPAICWSTRHALMALLSSVLCCAVLCTTENSRVSMVLLLLLLLFSAIYDRPFILLFLKKKREPKNVKKKKKVPVEKVLVLFHSFAFLHRLHKSGTKRQDATGRDAKSHLGILMKKLKRKRKRRKRHAERDDCADVIESIGRFVISLSLAVLQAPSRKSIITCEQERESVARYHRSIVSRGRGDARQVWTAEGTFLSLSIPIPILCNFIFSNQEFNHFLLFLLLLLLLLLFIKIVSRENLSLRLMSYSLVLYCTSTLSTQQWLMTM